MYDDGHFYTYILQDEVLAHSERMVLRLDQLAPLVEHEVKWQYGNTAYSCATSHAGGVAALGEKTVNNEADANGEKPFTAFVAFILQSAAGAC